MLTNVGWLGSSIRRQIAVPILGIQLATVISIAVATAALEAGRGEAEIVARLNGVMGALDHANFPYTPGVLARLRGLTGADFALLAGDGTPTEATLAGLDSIPPRLRHLRPLDRLESLSSLDTFVLDRASYYVAPLRATRGTGAASLLLLYPEASRRRARRDAALPPLGLGLAAIAVMGAVTSDTARRIGARLRRVQSQVARVAGGDFAGFEPGGRGDEIRELAVSVNQMCDQLRRMQQIIRQSERTRLMAQLAAGLAHQLRNSLTGARMSIQLHARRSPPRPGDEALDVALRQLAMTEEQVKGLLALGRDQPRRLAPCDLGRLLAEVVALVGPSSRHAGVTLRADLDPDLPAIAADESELRSAILNLMLNAVEAAPAGGRVEVTVVATAAEVAIEVGDDGPGPPPAIAETLLEAFVTSKPEGVGLGLAVADQVATGHGGRLTWSRRDGMTHFLLTLPRDQR